jgi:hypothetical protein
MRRSPYRGLFCGLTLRHCKRNEGKAKPMVLFGLGRKRKRRKHETRGVKGRGCGARVMRHGLKKLAFLVCPLALSHTSTV